MKILFRLGIVKCFACKKHVRKRNTVNKQIYFLKHKLFGMKGICYPCYDKSWNKKYNIKPWSQN